MGLFRATLVAALGLLFVFSTNRCLIASAFPAEVKECCPGERAPLSSESDMPCDGKDCLPCAVLESGVPLSSLVPLTLAAPVWTDDYELAELLRRLALAAAEEVEVPPPNPAVISSPPWCEVLMKALPVRGPSLVG